MASFLASELPSASSFSMIPKLWARRTDRCLVRAGHLAVTYCQRGEVFSRTVPWNGASFPSHSNVSPFLTSSNYILHIGAEVSFPVDPFLLAGEDLLPSLHYVPLLLSQSLAEWWGQILPGGWKRKLLNSRMRGTHTSF